MKFAWFGIWFLLLSVLIGSAQADDDIFSGEGVTSFQKSDDAWRRAEGNVPARSTAAPVQKNVLPEIKQAIGGNAWNNIENSEQVFCYEVSSKPAEFSGYTLNSTAITGFCGVIKPEVKKIILNDLFKSNKNVLFNVREECVIRPRILLRFIRGIDATDVLLSSPCYSFTVYYSGTVSVFNAKPAARIIDTLIASFSKNHVDFVSPALLGQLLPVGVPQTPEQKELVSKRPKPIRNWAVDRPKEAALEPEKKGWNNLNVGFK